MDIVEVVEPAPFVRELMVMALVEAYERDPSSAPEHALVLLSQAFIAIAKRYRIDCEDALAIMRTQWPGVHALPPASGKGVKS